MAASSRRQCGYSTEPVMHVGKFEGFSRKSKLRTVYWISNRTTLVTDEIKLRVRR
jgi:hypothetical protein